MSKRINKKTIRKSTQGKNSAKARYSVEIKNFTNTPESANLEYVPFKCPHEAVDQEFVMVLVTHNIHINFNTSVRYLDGVPKSIGRFMRAKKMRVYQGTVYGRPAHIMLKSDMKELFDLYGIYQLSMLKAYRLVNATVKSWSTPMLNEKIMRVLDENNVYVRELVYDLESDGRLAAEAAIYRGWFASGNASFGDGIG
jgi:hypothetical protein